MMTTRDASMVSKRCDSKAYNNAGALALSASGPLYRKSFDRPQQDGGV
jgi:hypothetical protein